MNNILTNKRLTIINFGIVAYFILLWSVYHFKIDHVMVGVIGELLTIPFMLAQLVFLIVSIAFLVKNKFNIWVVASAISLAACVFFTFGEFF
jgi:hypothetical protein